MNTVYSNESYLYQHLLLPKADNSQTADVYVWVIRSDADVTEVLSMLECYKRDAKSVYILTLEEISQQLQRLGINPRAIYLHDTTLCSVINKESGILKDVPILDFVKDSAVALSSRIMEDVVPQIATAFEAQLKSHSILTCTVALHELLLKSKIINLATYRDVLKYTSEIYRKVALAEEVYQSTHSHYLSVLASEKISKVVTSDYLEQCVRYIMLQPLSGEVSTTLNRTKEVIKF